MKEQLYGTSQKNQTVYSSPADFFAGLVVLSLGIDLNTKTQLGISPINSVPFNVHQLTGLPLHARHGTHRKAHLRPYREAL